MRRLLSWQLSTLLLLAGTAAAGQAPKLPPDHFNKCEWHQVGVHPRVDATELMLLTSCEAQLQAQKRKVLAVCLRPGEGVPPPRVIQACTESLARDGLQGEARSVVLAIRAQAYFAAGSLRQARADYTAAIELTPGNAELYCERGQVHLNQRNYQGAVADEAQAIRFDRHLARAYYLRSVALGDLGDQANAFSDLRTAVGLDASLGRYVVIKGKTVLLSLPPL
jgi:tetratricopeptide (TPR) repeat protein